MAGDDAIAYASAVELTELYRKQVSRRSKRRACYSIGSTRCSPSSTHSALSIGTAHSPRRALQNSAGGVANR